MIDQIIWLKQTFSIVSHILLNISLKDEAKHKGSRTHSINCRIIFTEFLPTNATKDLTLVIKPSTNDSGFEVVATYNGAALTVVEFIDDLVVVLIRERVVFIDLGVFVVFTRIAVVAFTNLVVAFLGLTVVFETLVELINLVVVIGILVVVCVLLVVVLLGLTDVVLTA